jgi:hypothetical protein
VVAAARDAFVAGMQLSSAIAAGLRVALAVLALVALPDQPAAITEATAEEMAAVSTSGDGRPVAADGVATGQGADGQRGHQAQPASPITQR